ncbi:MAG: NAD-dependent epimerase/dehydratase family protein [Bacteroidetes bacterium]|nr:NAD-dependent epimerase/dehydratase family protein [Bacteroidota bacterium]
MKCLVTGSTGFIGNRLVEELIKRSYHIHILVRSPKNIKQYNSKNVSIFYGDLLNTEEINKASKGCDFIFHLAAYANIWSKDKLLPFKTNVSGTKNILEAALKNGIKKVVFTSSAAIFPPSSFNEEVNESFPLPEIYLTDYETTKLQAEQLCKEYCKKGLNIVIINPPRVFGPGFLNKSNSITILINKYIKGTWRIIPGDGTQIGNYAFIDDVVLGHILALEKGVPGENYILGGTNLSYNTFFEILAKSSGKKFKLFHLPISFMLLISNFEFLMAETLGKKPLITPPWVKRYMQNRALSSKKAEKDIDYSITPIHEAITKTIFWLNQKRI